LQEGKGDGQASFTTDIRKMKSFLERQRRPREKPNLTFKVSREAVLAQVEAFGLCAAKRNVFIDSCTNNDKTREVYSNDVIPAKAGIQLFYCGFLDSCLRRSDKWRQSTLTLVLQLSIVPRAESSDSALGLIASRGNCRFDQAFSSFGAPPSNATLYSLAGFYVAEAVALADRACSRPV